MSHFTVAVLVRQDTVPEPGHPDFETKLEEAVCEMLAPFDEGIRVTPYDVPCSCAEDAAHSKAHDLSEKETGLTWQALKDQWWAKPHEERLATTWDDHTRVIRVVFDRHHEELLAVAKPDEDCDECQGTGIRQSQYNKMSKWDWYSVGGRWNGNYEEKGIPTIIPNVAFARDLHTAAYVPFAILSPREPHQKQSHDNWNEAGQMGWFAIVSNENDNWDAIALELLDKYAACFAVLVDCHI